MAMSSLSNWQEVRWPPDPSFVAPLHGICTGGSPSVYKPTSSGNPLQHPGLHYARRLTPVGGHFSFLHSLKADACDTPLPTYKMLLNSLVLSPPEVLPTLPYIWWSLTIMSPMPLKKVWYFCRFSWIRPRFCWPAPGSRRRTVLSTWGPQGDCGFF